MLEHAFYIAFGLWLSGTLFIFAYSYEREPILTSRERFRAWLGCMAWPVLLPLYIIWKVFK